jgi:hypothetical protein
VKEVQEWRYEFAKEAQDSLHNLENKRDQLFSLHRQKWIQGILNEEFALAAKNADAL